MPNAEWIDERDQSLLAAVGRLQPYFAEIVRDVGGWRIWAAVPRRESRVLVGRHASRDVAKVIAEAFLEAGGVRVRG